jgi:outer membrane protein assembly factor BamB
MSRFARAAALATVCSLGFAGIASAAGNSYAAYLGGPAHDSYAPTATTITVANAGAVASLWKRADIGTFNASPIVNNGIVYIGSENGTFYALNTVTGATIWSRTFTIANCLDTGFVSSATVAMTGGVLTVYVGAPDHYLYALRASDGSTIWRHLIGKATNVYYNWSSPTVSGGFVYYGVSTACDKNGVGNPGVDGVVALNQTTGKQTGAYYTGGCKTCLGASVHTSVAVGPDGSVWASTGNDNGETTNDDSTSIVKLHGGTLAKLGGYQIPGLDGLNSDFMASPTVFGSMVGACNKNGVFYAFAQSDPNTPSWQVTIGTPPTPDSLSFCGDAAVFDGTHLWVGANATPTNSMPGSIYELTTSGAVLWEKPLGTGPVVGGVSLDGSDVLAVPTYNTSGGHSAVYLMNANTGSILRTISYSGPIFAQPVFADGEVLIAGPTLQAYAP